MIRTCAATSATIAAAVLVGWSSGSAPLLLRFGTATPMAPLTATSLIVAAAGVTALTLTRHRYARLAAAGAGVAVMLLPTIAVLRQPNGRAVVLGMVAVNTGAALVLLGGAIVAAALRRQRMARVSTAGAAVIALAALIGYIYRVAAFYNLGLHVPMAMATSIVLLDLTAAMMLLASPHTAMRILSKGAAGLMARRLLPAAVILPVVLGSLQVLAERKGAVSSEFAQALSAAAHVLLLIAVTLATLRRLEQADRTRARSERMLAEAQRLARIGNWEYQPASGTLHVSAELRRLLDLHGTREVDLQTFLSRLPEAQALADVPVESARDGTILEIRSRMRGRGGDEHVIGTVQDVTARKAAEQRIAELLRQNELILRCAGEGICGIAAAGRITFANPAAAAMLHCSVEELIGAPLHRHLCPAEEECAIDQTLADGRTREVYDVTLTRDDGSTFAAEYIVAPMIGNAGETAAVVTFRDVTRRQMLERQVRQATDVETLGRVAASMAHEFNNVLMSIQPFAELIGRRGGPAVQDAAARISNGIARGRRVTEGILQLTRSAPASRTALELGEWLRELQPEVESLTGPQIDVRVETPAEPLWIAADPLQLQQVLMNLAANARDALAPGGRLTLRLLRDGADMARLEVIDTGSGIAADHLPHIFEPFYTTKTSGSGLGLAILRHIVSRHDGTITVDSAPGRGTTFRIILPLTDLRPVRQDAVAASRPPRPDRLAQRPGDHPQPVRAVVEGEGEGQYPPAADWQPRRPRTEGERDDCIGNAG